MTRTTALLLLWSPRVLGILVSAFIGLFALDESFPNFVVHVAPALFLLAIVGASWRWEWLGGVVFLALGVGYAAMVRGRLNWILVISVPLLIVGVLFLWSWRYHEELHAP